MRTKVCIFESGREEVVQAGGMKPYVPRGAFMRHLDAFQPLFRDRRLFQGFSTTVQGILASGGLRLSQIARCAPGT